MVFLIFSYSYLSYLFYCAILFNNFLGCFMVEYEVSDDEDVQKLSFEDLIQRYKSQIALFLIGLILLGFGAFKIKDDYIFGKPQVELLGEATEAYDNETELVVEVAGAVVNPGVYRFSTGDRIEDALVASGGLSEDADKGWMEKVLNRAAKLSDGQKIYIPKTGEKLSANYSNSSGGIGSDSGGSASVSTVNINSASQKELESLWGIGPVYAQNIIEHRPYSSVEELLTKKIIKQNVYDRNKDLLTIY